MSPADASVAIPGEVWILPPEAQGMDKENRRHAIVAPVFSTAPGTAVYGSTSTRARDGFRSPACTVQPSPSRNGLVTATHFYPTKLAAVYADELDRRAGTLGGLDRSRLRRSLREGLGIGQGRFCDAPENRRSWRGKIVEVAPDASEGGWLRYGLVVTCHAHSECLYYQVIVPLLTSDARWDHQLDVVIAKGPLVRLLGEEGQPVVLSVPLTTTVFHRVEVTGDTGITISPVDLNRIEDSLCTYLGCHLTID
jgi:hypothetical protein